MSVCYTPHFALLRWKLTLLGQRFAPAGSPVPWQSSDAVPLRFFVVPAGTVRRIHSCLSRALTLCPRSGWCFLAQTHTESCSNLRAHNLRCFLGSFSSQNVTVFRGLPAFYPQSKRVLALTTAHQAEYTFCNSLLHFLSGRLHSLPISSFQGVLIAFFPCLC